MNMTGAAIEPADAADDGRVIRIHAIAVQFLEIGCDYLEVVERVRPASGDARPARSATRVSFEKMLLVSVFALVVKARNLFD